MIITHDTGGALWEYIDNNLLTQGVVIDGECGSACTVYLSNKKVCATQNAKMFFHRPYLLDAFGNKVFDEAQDRFYLAHLPPKVRVYVQKRGLSEDGWWVYSTQVIAWVGECK